jgi:polysaccharide export outer membrane protein
MMSRHNHLSTAGLNQVPRRFSARLPLLTAVAVALCFCGSAANAQFSGPAVGASEQVNTTSAAPTTDPAILYPASRDIILQQGDLLVVHIYGTIDYNPSARVSLDGTIQLPLIGRLQVQGLTVHQTESLVAERLKSAGMYRDPQVTIDITEAPNQVVTITGEVHGVVPVAGRKRLFDVLSAAGGLPATASHEITIDRPGIPQPIVIDLGTDPAKSSSSNVPVFAGDTIIVPRVGVVYLLGAFRVQGAIPIQQNSPLTLMQVAALGGGPGYQGKLTDLRIIRTEGLSRKVVHVNIKKVMDGKAPDPVLQADDIVLLPTSMMKAAIKSGGVATLIGIGSLALYATQR